MREERKRINVLQFNILLLPGRHQPSLDLIKFIIVWIMHGQKGKFTQTFFHWCIWKTLEIEEKLF